MSSFINFWKMTARLSVVAILFAAFLSSCASYKQNIMFKTGDYSALEKERETAESNYVIQKNDQLTVDIYTNQGERIIDPNFESFSTTANQQNTRIEPPKYLVDKDGVAKLPFLNTIKLEGLTVRQAEEILEKEYTKLYQQPFVVLKVINRRVTVLGAPGGKVVPLLDENVRLAEVLAMAGGINIDGKAANIRVLRGDKIFLADMSTVEGYLRDNMLIHSGDIVYVEPVRRPFFEGIRDYGPLFSLITGLGTITLLILRTN